MCIRFIYVVHFLIMVSFCKCPEGSETLSPPLMCLSVGCKSRHQAAACCVDEAQEKIRCHVWICGHTDDISVKMTEDGQRSPRDWADSVCGLLVPSLDCLNRWYFCWPIRSTERPGTHGGLAFVTAWNERSVAAAVFFPHMGVVGTARWKVCVSAGAVKH